MAAPFSCSSSPGDRRTDTTVARPRLGSLGLDYLGIPKIAGVAVATVIVIAAASTGSFRRFERVCMTLIVGSFILLPIVVMVHPTAAEVARGLFIPNIPAQSDLSKSGTSHYRHGRHHGGTLAVIFSAILSNR